MYLILAGLIVLYYFYKRQVMLESENRNPLLRVSMLKIKALRSGVAVLCGQYLITAAIFFVVPIYLQMVLGYDALDTGKKIFPLSVGIVLFSLLGSKLISRFSPRQIIRFGQSLLIFGAIVLTGAINPELKGFLFGASMFIVGAGLGLLASQIGNVNMSAVDESKSSEVGGLQGTFQNFGSSLGTALIGSVMIMSLTAGFINSINSNPSIPSSVQSQVDKQSKTGIPIATSSQVESYALQSGLNESQAQSLASDYENSQIKSLKLSMAFLVIIAILTIPLSKGIPNKKLS